MNFSQLQMLEKLLWQVDGEYYGMKAVCIEIIRECEFAVKYGDFGLLFIGDSAATQDAFKYYLDVTGIKHKGGIFYFQNEHVTPSLKYVLDYLRSKLDADKFQKIAHFTPTLHLPELHAYYKRVNPIKEDVTLFKKVRSEHSVYWHYCQQTLSRWCWQFWKYRSEETAQFSSRLLILSYALTGHGKRETQDALKKMYSPERLKSFFKSCDIDFDTTALTAANDVTFTLGEQQTAAKCIARLFWKHKRDWLVNDKLLRMYYLDSIVTVCGYEFHKPFFLNDKSPPMPKCPIPIKKAVEFLYTVFYRLEYLGNDEQLQGTRLSDICTLDDIDEELSSYAENIYVTLDGVEMIECADVDQYFFITLDEYQDYVESPMPLEYLDDRTQKNLLFMCNLFGMKHTF